MKKVIRVVWISLLTGLAFLIACTTQGRLSRSEKKQLKQERENIEMTLKDKAELSPNNPRTLLEYKQWEIDQRTRLDEINALLLDEEARSENQAIIERVKSEIEELKAVISQPRPLVYGPPTKTPRPSRNDDPQP